MKQSVLTCRAFRQARIDRQHHTPPCLALVASGGWANSGRGQPRPASIGRIWQSVWRKAASGCGLPAAPPSIAGRGASRPHAASPARSADGARDLQGHGRRPTATDDPEGGSAARRRHLSDSFPVKVVQCWGTAFYPVSVNIGMMSQRREALPLPQRLRRGMLRARLVMARAPEAERKANPWRVLISGPTASAVWPTGTP
jgi:hypothetical protein